MILQLIDEAVESGARLDRACHILGLRARTVQRWRRQGEQGFDRRFGPKSSPCNKLSPAERQKVLEAANRPEYRELSPKQIVPLLADEGVFLASESTFYRFLHEENALHHREPSRPRSVFRPREHVATGPCEVFSWDITYLRSAVRGAFYYLYLVEDIWSRKIVGWAVHEEESMDLAARLIDDTATRLGCDLSGLVLHSDNGGPMKGSTMLATLQRLGIVPSFSRPHVSDDNPYSESLFRTLKYRPEYPRGAFASLEAARQWVESFVAWYNTEHLHSAIGFVTPEDRHTGRDEAILAARQQTYEDARRRHPERWARNTRNWERVEVVTLNPEKDKVAA
jgi:transposase InsO family protein